jgi:single-stranded-DNA-specific exonuclease
MEKPSRWLLPQVDETDARSLASNLGLTLPATRVLLHRGYGDTVSAGRYLQPSLEDLHDPYLMLGMDRAAARLKRAVKNNEQVLLYGDYDVDGTTAVVVLAKAIELAGGREAAFHIPHRLHDGYGMQPQVIEKAASDGVRLIVTVDTGIRAAEAVCLAGRLGLDVIVTDHHLPDTALPPALAVLNPKQPGCAYPNRNLCGVGVAFKLAQALLGALGWPAAKLQRMTESFLKLVAIGTIADVVPLTGENRAIVKIGLDGLRHVRNAGLRELLQVAGFGAGEDLSAGNVAFRIAPRLNAAGRMAHARDIVELLLTRNQARARAIAESLHEWNRERQDTEAEIVRLVLEECLAQPVTDLQAALVFCGKGWHRGVVGIVASRLVERFHRPVFVLGEDEETGLMQGSGRSIPRLHLLDALETMPELFSRFGGHSQAAGVALAPESVEEFRARLNCYAAERLSADDFRAEIPVDAPIGLDEIGDRSVADVFSLAPFGSGNSMPVFVVRGAELAGAPGILKERHLRFSLRQNNRVLGLTAWNMAHRSGDLIPNRPVDAAFSFEHDRYSGWRAVLKDFRPAV